MMKTMMMQVTGCVGLQHMEVMGERIVRVMNEERLRTTATGDSEGDEMVASTSIRSVTKYSRNRRGTENDYKVHNDTVTRSLESSFNAEVTDYIAVVGQ